MNDYLAASNFKSAIMVKRVPLPKYNPYEQNRETKRLPDHDYACSGIYYVTCNTRQGYCFFGDVVDGKCRYSPQGYIADIYLYDLQKHFPKMKVITYCIMPNHIHILLELLNPEADFAAFLREGEEKTMREYRKESVGSCSLSSIIRSFKAAVTFNCHRLGLEMAWQPRFYDHVVRSTDEKELFITYIQKNPERWNKVLIDEGTDGDEDMGAHGL